MEDKQFEKVKAIDKGFVSTYKWMFCLYFIFIILGNIQVH
jgi:hypothetical protein